MRLLYTAFVSLIMITVSCNKPHITEDTWLNATVIATKDINCNYPRLDFSDDSTRVRLITGEAYSLQFICKGLPYEYNIQGKRFKVQIVNLSSEESFPCFTLGINYPAIKIVNARAQ